MVQPTREDLVKAISKASSDFRVVATDADSDDDETSEATDLPSTSLDAVRAKYEKIFHERASGHPISKTSHFVLLEPDDDALRDDPSTPARRIVVVSNDGEVVAEQG